MMKQSLLRTLLFTLLLPLFANNVVFAQDIKHGLRDDIGRHMIPRGWIWCYVALKCMATNRLGSSHITFYIAWKGLWARSVSRSNLRY